MASVTIKTLALQNGTDRTVYVTWKFSKSNVDYYRIIWDYSTGNNVWFQGQVDRISQKTDTYSAPSNATKVRAKIKPFGTSKANWTGSSVTSDTYYFSANPPATPSAPSVSLDSTAESSGDNKGKYKMTATIENISDSLTDYVEFCFYMDNKKKNVGTAISKKKNDRVIAYYYLAPGSVYNVKARAINSLSSATGTNSDKLTFVGGDDNTTYTITNRIYSDWSAFSYDITPSPDQVTGVKCSAYDNNTVKVTWSSATGAETYEIQYATTKEYLETSTGDSQSTKTNDSSTTAYISSLTTGQTWYFRVRANNNSGSGTWSDIVSTVIGSTPEAPTTWSSASVVTIGETVNLYWVHNCEDGSDQTSAQIRLTPSTGSAQTITVSGDTASYALDTSSYTDGIELKWQVRTAGITTEYGEYSINRSINIYAPVNLGIEVAESISSLPINIVVEASPASQTVVGYYLSITAENSYETTDNTGSDVYVNAGEEIFSKLYNESTNPITMVISVGDCTFESGETYNVTITVSMSSGVTAETTASFTIVWQGSDYEPDASIAIDPDTLVAYIIPRCDEVTVWDDNDDPVSTQLVEGVTLGVYRREYDGSFTLIGDGLENSGVASITDPHPALDYARYRITARDEKTGQISYEDLSGIEIGEPAIVIQWDEEWKSFDYDDVNDIAEDAWGGSMLKLPGNVDIQEQHDQDVELVEYTGRSHPVSYYGTHQGESGSWSSEISKDDKETLYALRRLALYMGDVYVREPSGIGYWANINVSMQTKHCDLTIPVTLQINRVEGGM